MMAGGPIKLDMLFKTFIVSSFNAEERETQSGSEKRLSPQLNSLYTSASLKSVKFVKTSTIFFINFNYFHFKKQRKL